MRGNIAFALLASSLQQSLKVSHLSMTASQSWWQVLGLGHDTTDSHLCSPACHHQDVAGGQERLKVLKMLARSHITLRGHHASRYGV